MTPDNQWFTEWFDSPFYQLLYKDRNDLEASNFLNKLIPKLNLSQGSKCLDVACGKGRHSGYLHELGYEVAGFDLSSRNIEQASVKSSEGLRFYQHDMRDTFLESKQDVVLNLFTSFGYFDEVEENVQILRNIHSCLQHGGKLVLDYLNPRYTIDQLVAEELKEVGGTTFKLKRFVKDEFICKQIEFLDQQKSYCYIEKVRAFDAAWFSEMFGAVGLEVVDILGDYELNQFDVNNSSRMIFVASK